MGTRAPEVPDGLSARRRRDRRRPHRRRDRGATPEDAETGQIPAVTDPSLWDPMPVTLPTYVAKPAAAPRSVRTIDLDSTGVWTSGRTDADAQLAREADAAAKARSDSRRRPKPRRRLLTPSISSRPAVLVLTFPTAWGCGAVGSASRSQ